MKIKIEYWCSICGKHIDNKTDLVVHRCGNSKYQTFKEVLKTKITLFMDNDK